MVAPVTVANNAAVDICARVSVGTFYFSWVCTTIRMGGPYGHSEELPDGFPK